MNKERIRIYQLSKELNRDNQELLALCAQLNIAARSHSSTIREFDADRLRLIAKKQAKSVLSHKQQILGIRKSKLSERTKSQQSVARSDKSPVASAVTSGPPSASPIKLTAPTRPAEKPERSQGKSKADTVREADEYHKRTPRFHKEVGVLPKTKAVPELAKPPVRQLSSAERSTPKRSRIEQARHQPVKTTQKNLAAKPVRPTSDEQVDVQKLQKSESVTTQPLPELRRPKPVPSVESETPTVTLLPKPTRVTAGAQEWELKSPELPESPKPPRPYKTGKKRRPEEIDGERETKASKAGTRVKHQLRLVELEEEEDWQATKLAPDALIPVNPAMARPAKQPGSGSPARVSLTATAAKSKKRHEVKGDRHKPQELEPKRERPEKLVVTGSMTVAELAEALAVRDTALVTS